MNKLNSPDADRRFDRWSKRYDGWRSQQFFSRLHLRLLRHIEAGCAHGILDVGCGTGNLAVLLSDLYPGIRVAGVDASAGMVEVAASKAGARGNLDFEVAAAERLPYADSSFGLVISTMSFHHWTDPPRGVSECLRVLGTGGELLIVDIVSDSRLAPVYQVFGPLRAMVTRSHYASKAYIREQLIRESFNPVVQETIWPAITLTRGRKPQAL
jgi:ubiquinone/menaquinone biosynthesis C-methylase UbiE